MQKKFLHKKYISIIVTLLLFGIAVSPSFNAIKTTKLIDYIVNSYQEMEDGQATEEDSTVEAGLTPDNFFYFLDRMVENVQLSLTSDSIEKAKLLTEIALERLAELNSLDEISISQFIYNFIHEGPESLPIVRTVHNRAD